VQDCPFALGDCDAKLNVGPLPAWKQDHDDVGTNHCISLTLPDGAEIIQGDRADATDAFMGPVVRVDVSHVFQGSRDVSDVDDIPEA
jgi:hypothetical protein